MKRSADVAAAQEDHIFVAINLDVNFPVRPTWLDDAASCAATRGGLRKVTVHRSTSQANLERGGSNSLPILLGPVPPSTIASGVDSFNHLGWNEKSNFYATMAA